MTLNQAISAFSFSANAHNSQGIAKWPGVSIRKILSESNGKWRESVVRQLNELVALNDGWDGYRGVPVSFENAHFAMQVIDAICDAETPAPQIVPGTDGDLQIEWHTLNGDIELHVIGPNNVRAWYSNAHDVTEGEERHLTNDFLCVADWVRKVTEQQIAAEAAAA
jgi:hypothetical protein